MLLKRSAAAVLAVVTVFANSYSVGAAAVGDVNGDGAVNVTDISLTAAHVKSLKALSGDSLSAADADGSGAVNVTDISLIAAHVKSIKALGDTESPDADDDSKKDDSKTDVSKPDEVEGDYIVTYSSDNTWQDGGVNMFGLELGFTNKSGKPIDGWKLELVVDGLDNVSGWNGEWSQDGDTLTVTNADHNGTVADGGSVKLGCNMGVGGELKIVSAKLNGEDCVIVKGEVPEGSGETPRQDDKKQDDKKQDDSEQKDGKGSADVDKLLERSPDAVQGDDWLHTDGSHIYDKDGKEVWLTGVNWFGYNTGTNAFDGLWNSNLESSVKSIADHGFNLIRVPISAQLLNEWAAGEYPKANFNTADNPTLTQMDSLEIFDYFLKLAEENGMKVMPDIHSAETDAMGHNANLWFTSKVSADEYYSALEWLADRYKDNDTIIAIDLKNEPHGKPNEGDKAAIWNDSKADNNWKYVAETAAKKVLAKNPNVLIMVEGTEIFPKDTAKNGDYHSSASADYFFNWWGGNLRGVKEYPVDLGEYQDKLVYSPHDYGPGVYEQPWFEGGYDYESLKKDCWNDNWLYIKTDDIAPLLIGEWGGFMKQPNLKWMTYMRQLISENHLNHTFWCFNANSGDTGGLVLDDFKTWDDDKYEFVKEVLWQEGDKFVGLDHEIPLGENGITLGEAKGLK